jgi:hypothetical protein
MKKSDIIPIQRIKVLIEKLKLKINFYDKGKIQNSKNWSLCDLFSNKLEFEISSERSNLIKKQKSTFDISKGYSPNNNFDLEIKNLIYDFNLGLFEAYDEDKHFNIDSNDQDKTFDKFKFINDSKPDIKAFLDAIKDRPVILYYYYYFYK